MARFTAIDDPMDPRLGDFVSLRDSQLRQRLEGREGLFIAEGEKVIRRALESGHRPRSFLLSPRWIAGLRDVLEEHDVDVWVVDEALAEQVTGFHVHRGALASLHRTVSRPWRDLLGMGRVVLVEDVVDHANLGAIVRSAAALGWEGMIVSPRCADPLYRRAVKTSMGAVFTLPWARMVDPVEALAEVRGAGFLVVAAALSPDAVTLDDAAELVGDRRVALMVGTEGAGLSDSWLAAADLVVQIPMAAGIDSLNVAAAAAVLCWELRPRPAERQGRWISPRPVQVR